MDTTDQVEANNSQQKAQKSNILFFGNSLTAGLGLPEDEAYPSLIQERIDSLGLNYNVINAGLSGETSSAGLERIDWVLNQPVAIFLLELGANDMLRGLDVQSTKENLNQILKKVRSTYPDAKIIVAGMQAAPNMGPDYINAFNKIYPDLASSFEASLIPFFLEGVAGIDSLNLKDRKHPNAKGQKVVMENVWKVLYPLL
jgi:acyl-CoA thioesterase-1